VRRGAEGRPGALLVLFEQPNRQPPQAWGVLPEQLVRAAEWETALAGGYRRGDTVVSVDHQGETAAGSVVRGQRGVVSGPSAREPAERLFVLFEGGVGTWHVRASSVMREAEWSGTAHELRSRSDRDEVASDEVGREMTVTVLSASPSILRIEGFLRAAEVDALLARGRPRLQRSRVHGAATADGGGEAELEEEKEESATTNEYRTSSSFVYSGQHAWAPELIAAQVHKDPCCHSLSKSPPELIASQKRLSAFTGLDWRNSENVQLVRYRQGQCFRPHTDYFNVRIHNDPCCAFLK